MFGSQYARMGFKSTPALQKKVTIGEYVDALETKISGISQIVRNL
jgi:hypothetical protein